MKNNLNLNILSNASCETSNIIYVIICNKCKLYYVGETSKSLRERFKQHLNHIINFVPFVKYHDKVVARHFRSNNHSLSDLKVCVFKSDLNDTEIRKQKEQDLINFLNIKNKLCINELLSLKFNSKSYIFI